MLRKANLATASGIGALLLLIATAAHAAPLTFSYTGSDRSAQLSFEVDEDHPDNLIVRLTNTWGGETDVNDYVLQAVYFDGPDWMAGLTPSEAWAPHGVLNVSPDDPDDAVEVSDRWAFNPDFDPRPGYIGGMGLGSVGLGEDGFEGFKDSQLFKEPDSDGGPGRGRGNSGGGGPQGLAEGPSYGIVSDTSDQPQSGPDDRPFVRYEVEFTFTGLNGLDDGVPLDEYGRVAGFNNASFQYGTGFDPEPYEQLPPTDPIDPNPHLVPSPSAASAGFAMMMLLAFNLWFSRARQRLAHQPA